MGQKALHHVADRPRHEAQILLSHALNKELIWLLSNENTPVEEEPYLSLIKRRADYEPIEYITSTVSFYSEEFISAPGALIPRPETEILIDKVLENVSKDFEGHIVEVGVGSGIISIMLAKHIPGAKITAIDISDEALAVARLNIEKFGVDDRITLIKGNLLDPVTEGIDLLVSNPPYIEDDLELPKSLAFEPQNALYGGKKGDELLKTLITQASQRAIPLVVCEMGYDQRLSIDRFVQHNSHYRVTFYKDLAALDRGFVLKEEDA